MHNGDVVDQNLPVWQLKCKEGDVILCIHTFGESKPWCRFNEERVSYGWCMNLNENNAIVFVPSKPLAINGFALYAGTGDYGNSYKMGYKVIINGKEIAYVKQREFTWEEGQRHVRIDLDTYYEVDAGGKINIVVWKSCEATSRWDYTYFSRAGGIPDNLQNDDNYLFSTEDSPDNQD